jgi:hypothetical protein
LTLTTPNYRGTWPLIEWTLDALRLVPRLADAQHVSRFRRDTIETILASTGWRVRQLTTFSTLAPFVSLASWNLATRCSALEDRMSLSWGNVIWCVATAEAP